MKLHPPTTILALVGAAFAAMAVSNENSQARIESRSHENRDECEVARAYVELAFADGAAFPGEKPIHLVTERLRELDIATFLASPSTTPSARANPLLPLFVELEEREDEHVVDTCPGILDINARLRKNDPEEKPVVKPDGFFDRIYFGLSVPAVSKDGEQALLLAGFTYAGLAGGGQQVLMQKDGDGRWQIALSQPTWIS